MFLRTVSTRGKGRRNISDLSAFIPGKESFPNRLQLTYETLGPHYLLIPIILRQTRINVAV